ncbi:hypothetical protein KKC13_04790 [bacterium]|nr:hypothetical protein [bacterium]MBU1958544.1 hypothetical protein [bacterium]
MKKIVFVIAMSLALVLSSEASTRSDVQIIEASENIRYLSQKISKDYLFLYQNPEKRTLRNQLEESLKQLEREINTIAINTQSTESKDLLNFLRYTNQEIKALLKEKVNKDKSILILDYSETFVEAANSIEHLHQYNFSNEEKMLMSLKELDYLFERITKYYIASAMNLNKMSNANQIKNSIVKIENILYAINNYAYPTPLLNEREKMNEYWTTYKEFIYQSDDCSVPNLLEVFVESFKNSMDNIELYHKKNQ